MNKSVLTKQEIPFAISLIIFMTAAVFGWIKLRYGFNFIDEGYHMTEAWRLTAGDDFFRDKFTGALRASTLINFLIFKALPNITLLGFRELQWGLTIFSLLMLSFALYTVNSQFWFQPLIFSVFAFTGLDPVGMISNVYYQTYPHLFITLHLACFIVGLHQESLLLKRIFYVLSGVFLWLISFSLLHMSLVVASPIVLFFLIRLFRIEEIKFTLTDLCYVLAPVLLCWAVFIGIFQMPFIENVFASIQLILSTPTHAAGELFSINQEALKHVVVTLAFVLACWYCTRLSNSLLAGGALAILAVVMFTIIDTSLFGFILPYYNGWFGRPMWFSALVVSSYFLYIVYFIGKVLTKRKWDDLELLALIMIIPCIIMAASSSIFSGLGFLTVLHSAIPAVAAMTCLTLSLSTVKNRVYLVKFMLLLLFLVPFYYSTAWSDWKFTFFDVAPAQADVIIDEGFGKGIRTNQTFKSLYDWVGMTSEKYSTTNDYIISYIVSPMVHMISRRRPALDDPFISFAEVPVDYYKDAIVFMKEKRREPRLAYVFEGMPGLMPISLKEGTFKWFDKQFIFPSDDPISMYIVENMIPIDRFKISDELVVKCFIDKSFLLEEQLRIEPNNPDLLVKMGNFYQKRGDLDKAEKFYKKTLELYPRYLSALQNMAIIYSRKGNDNAAIDVFKVIISIDPDCKNAYYNIACVYAKQHKINDSIMWLRKAVENGFDNWNLLRTDCDLNNLRDTPYYKDIVRNHHSENQ